jgi:hypothetical protein
VLLAPLLLLVFSADPTEHFEMKVRPILANRCFGCHSTAPLGGLTMTSRNGLLKGGKTGPALVPGNVSESLLIQAIEHTNDKMKMPLGSAKIPDSEITVLRDWVRDGAFWPEVKTPAATGPGYQITAEQRRFWAFQPVRKPALPAIRQSNWVRGGIDAFVLARLEEKGITPNPPASPRDWLRRVYLALTGLPPTFDQVKAFEEDTAPNAAARVVDQLLASPHFGERWGRYWLDVARYADDRLDSDVELPYPNSFRYRDWVIAAFNRDMPYDLFVKAQIAGDQVGKDPSLAVGLGFYGLSPELTDDRVDVTTRGFLGLTGACAQCHDHKFDPIPTKDFYALQGVFTSTRRAEYELAAAPEVAKWKEQDKRIQEVKKRIEAFLHNQAMSVAEALAADSPRYIRAARAIVLRGENSGEGLDAVTLARWVKYLKSGPKDNRYLRGWEREDFDLTSFRREALSVLRERKEVDEKNLAAKATNDPQAKGETFALPTERYFLWRDLFFSDFYGREFKQEEDGLLYYGPNRGYLTTDGTVERFLEGYTKDYLGQMRAELKELRMGLPEKYAFAHVIRDNAAPVNERVQIGGQPERLGEEAPRAFLSILSSGAPQPFSQGSGRKELAEAIANAGNPLTARVFVNRIWQRLFGEGLVRTVSNFGLMGDRPSHPELLDYLASEFVEQGWSTKKLLRMIVLSRTYQSSSAPNEAASQADGGNRLLWRVNRQRLDAEAMRDTLLAVTGELDRKSGGPPVLLDKPEVKRRSVYGYVSRRKLDGTLALFDFPNPNLSAEQRITTATPLQQLFFLNSEFLQARAAALTGRLALVRGDRERVREAYRLLYGREASERETSASLAYLADGGDWTGYAQVLLAANELVFVN